MPTSPLKIVFAGTPEFAAASLQALFDNQEAKQYELVGVYTQPDRPAGRGQKLVQSPVKQLALAHDIPVFQPLNFKNEDDKAELAALNADLMIVAAYGIILPKVVLDTPKLGCINVHASLLPRWRGAAPIHRAIIAGDKETGITIMQMDVGLDTGDMLLKSYCEIEETDTSASLHDKLADLGGQTLIQSLDLLQAAKLEPVQQDESLTCYATKLVKQEGDIEWAEDAETIARKIRGLSPWPTAFTTSQAGIMKIHAAQPSDTSTNAGTTNASTGEIIAATKEGLLVSTGDGCILITSIQFAGSKRMSVQDALNGKHKAALQVGQKLTSSNNENN